MRVIRLKKSKILLFLLVLLPIYQDSPLSMYLGAAGYTIIMPLSLILFVISVLFSKKIYKNEYCNVLWILGAWTIAVGSVAIIIWIAAGNPITIVGEYLPLKEIKVALQFFSFPAYISLVCMCVKKAGILPFLQYIFCVLVLLSAICIVEQVQIPYAFQSIHFAGVFPYWRVRLLTPESSSTAMLIYVYAGLSIYYGLSVQKRLITFVAVICTGILLFSSGSKSLLGAVIVTPVIFMAINFKKISKRSLVSILLAAVIVAVFVMTLLPNLKESLLRDIQRFTSVATRGYTMFVSLVLGIIFPIGTGGAVSVGVFQRALSAGLVQFEKVFPYLRTMEIASLARSNTDVALTVKSGLLQFNLYWGILGTLLLLKNFRKLGKRTAAIEETYKNLLCSLWSTAILMVTFSAAMSFEFWLLYAFLICKSGESRGS